MAHGSWKKWYDDGSPCSESYYININRAGVWKNWWPNGTQSYQGEFLSGQHFGIHVSWHPNGQKSEERDYQAQLAIISSKPRITKWDENGVQIK